MKRTADCIARIALYAFLSLVFIISILPLVWILLSSFKTNAEILSDPMGLPRSWGFAGYTAAFKIAPLSRFYLNSLTITTLSTIGNVFFISMSAYVAANFSFKFKTAVVAMFAFTLLIPMTSLIFPVYMLMNKLGLTDTQPGLILVYISLGFPTTFFIMRGFFMSIPRSLPEAAYIDGAGFYQTFFRIAVPVARPGLATAAILQFLAAWNEFLYALVLTSSARARTLPLAVNYFTSLFSFNYTAMFAAIAVIVLPSVIIYILLQEQVVGSLTAGSIKG